MRPFITLTLFLTAFGFLAPAGWADEKKSGFFVLGIHMSGAQSVAEEFIGDPTTIRPGGMALIKRNLTWSIELADALKVPSDALKKLAAEVDRLSFAEIAARLDGIRSPYPATLDKLVAPGAGAYFILGIQHSGAEGVALKVRDFARADKPGSGKLIERNLKWMADAAPTLKLSTTLLTKIQEDTARDATFTSIRDQLEALRLLWQKELSAQPGFGSVVAGTLVFNTAGTITAADPLDRERRDSRCKVHEVRLHAGMVYIIDVESGDGRSGPHNPTFFDTWLRIEDAAGKTLESNDDGGDNLNSRIEFRPRADGAYRLVVTTYVSGATGSYTIKVRQR